MTGFSSPREANGFVWIVYEEISLAHPTSLPGMLNEDNSSTRLNGLLQALKEILLFF